MRMVGWRNRILGNPGFQRWAAASPFLRPVARARAGALFDLVAGFAYSQVLLSAVESGCVERLAAGPCSTSEMARIAGLSQNAAERLLRAAAAIGIAQEVARQGGEAWWMLGRHGAALHGNEGALAMIRHHRLLYADLADPLALLRQDRAEPTHLSRFWTYAAEGAEGDANAYSQLMAASQAPVVEQVLAACDLSRHDSLLDVGGGHGAFLRGVAQACPKLRLGLFDLPEVIESAHESLGESVALHQGSFFDDDLPRGYDCSSLVRILHDHDDAPAMRLLANIRRSLEPGGTLLIAEPMAATRGAEAMGDAYFGLYLWAMRSGRPRSAREIQTMLREAGFASSRSIATRQPLITSLIVART
ncbi:methyltransferase domain-containing protein [Alteriqipengyuania lutimaris]|uniref:Methyltransferase domain-containing protein n=1 Tax=Alteriqipengyuania lutimaris TaxID=1538146 RepID=A0A395LPA6_9SPHN|nr:methyltransferase domain-containing protein [Alteriqipengyuania lutimaris]